MTRTDRRQLLRTTAGALGAMSLAPRLTLAESVLRLAEPMDVAVVGCGRQGRAILVELQKIGGARIAALCDTHPARLSSGERRVRGAKTYPDHRALLENEPSVKAVFVATPTHRHRDVAVDALAAGRHVFCEAPLASTLDDCRAIARAARAAKTTFQTGMQGRSNPIYDLARSFYRSGMIRDTVGLRAQYHDDRKSSWRVPADGPDEERELNWKLDPAVSLGLFGEAGVQQIDVFNWFLHAYPTSVRGSGALYLHDDGRTMPDTETFELTYPDGVRLTYEATLANSFDGPYELIHGTMGTIKLAWNAGWLFKEFDAPTYEWEVYANREQFHDEQGITLIADATQLAAQDKLKEGIGLPNPPLYYAIETFLESATAGAPVVCTADEGLRAAAIGIAAREALVSGETRAIDPASFEDE